MSLHTFSFDYGWKFINDFREDMIRNDFDDSAWKDVVLPHDWSVEGAFSRDSPMFERGAWLPAGMGCYRKTFVPPPEAEGKRVLLHFGGIFRNSEIFVNGKKAGGREWGFVSFDADITDFLTSGENTVVVKVDQDDLPSCRWYSGSGIHRHVRMELYDGALEFPRYGVYLLQYPQNITREHAEFYVKYEIRNRSSKYISANVRHIVTAPDGTVVHDVTSPHETRARLTLTMAEIVHLDNPDLWTPDHPALYRLRSVLSDASGEIRDVFETNFGLRSCVFDKDKGFLLNGVPTKIHGVGLHADGGALGAAVLKKTTLRQLQILKGMGVNAVRTAHNPYSEEFLDACDEAGMLVFGEIFDEWQEPIRVGPFGNGEPQTTYTRYYAHLFDTHAVRDLTDIVLRDRNHPSLFLWSIGNEIPQMHKHSGLPVVRRFVEIIHKLDEVRPVTSAVTQGDPILPDNMDALDIPGYNYAVGKRLDVLRALVPEKPVVVTESHSVRSMLPFGVYPPAGKTPADSYTYPVARNFILRHSDRKLGIRADRSCEERAFVAGHFAWTGFDYLAEPTPYSWPAHSSFYGIFNTCGFPKDEAYYYYAFWKNDGPLVHIASAWDFAPGDTAEIRVFTNCALVELFLNGKSLGIRAADAVCGPWIVPFVPGELKAVAYAENSLEPSASDSVHTSGKPTELRLSPWFGTPLKTGAQDLEYVKAELFDDAGHPVRNPMFPVRFSVSGPVRIAGLDNGYSLTTEPYQGTDTRSTCDGKCLCIVKSDVRLTGPARLTAECAGLSASLDMQVTV